MPKTLAQTWLAESRLAQSAAEGHLAFVRFVLFAGVAINIASLVYSFASRQIGTALVGCVALGVLTWAGARYRRGMEIAQAILATGEPLAGPSIEALRAIIVPITRAMGLSSRPLRLVRLRGIGLTPVMAEDGETIELRVPRGFERIVGREPGLARSVIAHEMGHASQHDYRLWVEARVLWSACLLPLAFHLGFSLLVSVAIAIGYWAAGDRRSVAIMSISWPLSAAFYIAIFAAYRFRLRRSEWLADLAALLYADREDQRRAIVELTPDVEGRWWRSEHLSHSRRLAGLDRLACLERGDLASASVPIDPPHPRRAEWLGRSGFLCFILGIALLIISIVIYDTDSRIAMVVQGASLTLCGLGVLTLLAAGFVTSRGRARSAIAYFLIGLVSVPIGFSLLLLGAPFCCYIVIPLGIGCLNMALFQWIIWLFGRRKETM